MPEPRRRRTRPGSRVRLAVTALVGCLLLGTTGTTGASWTDDAAIPGTPVHAGRVDLRVNGLDALTGYTALSTNDLVPGRSTASVLTVANQGSVPLDYTVATSGSNADGKGLFGGLQRKITGATTVTSTATGSTCGGAALSGARSLAAGASEKVCVELLLPSAAPAVLATAATDVTVAVGGSNHGWTDGIDVTGSHLATIPLQAPSPTCGPASVGSVTVSWLPVRGATGYRINSTALGGGVEDVPATTLSKTFVGLQGIASVQAIFGSTNWISPNSRNVSFSALTGVLGTCS